MSPLNSIGRKAVQAFDELGQAPAPRRFFPQEAGDTGSSFPYGSEWWMGYTIQATGITIHNVLLHYNRGAILGDAAVVFTPTAGATPQILGFNLDLSTGLFAAVTTTNLSDFEQQGDGDGLFRFPVYRFLVSAADTPGEISVEFLSDYVHGSNLGGL